MNNKFPRCKARKSERVAFPFVLDNDIVALHGDEWKKKFDKYIYGSTGGCYEENGKVLFAIYHHDYLRFADAIDYKKPTYFD